VFVVNLTWVGDGADEQIAGYPLMLRREAGIWKMDYDRLAAMMRIP
jgi:asparagine synthetase B (glutamine-hydrolysing)